MKANNRDEYNKYRTHLPWTRDTVPSLCSGGGGGGAKRSRSLRRRATVSRWLLCCLISTVRTACLVVRVAACCWIVCVFGVRVCVYVAPEPYSLILLLIVAAATTTLSGHCVLRELCWIWWTKWPNSSSKHRLRSSKSRTNGQKWWTTIHRCSRLNTIKATVSRLRPVTYMVWKSWTTCSLVRRWNPWTSRRRRRHRALNAEWTTTMLAWRWRRTPTILAKRSVGPWKTSCTRSMTKSPDVFAITKSP